MTKIQHDIWQCPKGLTSLCFSGELGKESRSINEPGSRIIHTFYAESHFDAMTKYYSFMQWGIYSTEFEIDKEPYDLESLTRRSRIWINVDFILRNEWQNSQILSEEAMSQLRDAVQTIFKLVYSNRSLEDITEILSSMKNNGRLQIGDKSNCKEIAKKIITTTR